MSHLSASTAGQPEQRVLPLTVMSFGFEHLCLIQPYARIFHVILIYIFFLYISIYKPQGLELSGSSFKSAVIEQIRFGYELISSAVG